MASVIQRMRPVEANLPDVGPALQDRGERVERLGVTPQVEQDRAAENEGRGVIGIKANGRVRRRERLGVPAQAVQLNGDLVLDIGHRRVELDRLTVRVERFFMPVELRQRQAAQPVGLRVARLDPDGLISRIEGRRVVVRLHQA
jgi:hypothetical protein